MNSGSAVLAVSLTALAALSLPGKLRTESVRNDAEAFAPAERIAADTLEAHRWVAGDTLPLTEDGLYRVHSFHGPVCGDAIFLTEVSANGEIGSLLAELGGADGQILFLQGGRLYTEISSLRAYLQDKLGPFLTKVGLLDTAGHHRLVAIVATGACRDAAHLPWPMAPAS